MSQVFQCPRCETRLGVPDVLVGSEVKCGSCLTVFVASRDGAGHLKPAPPPAQPIEPVALPEPPSEPIAEPADEYEYVRRRRRRRRDLMQNRGGLILALGIVGFFLLPIVFGPMAWSMGHHDLKEMREGRMDPDGEGATRAGYVCGIINTCMVLVAIVLVIAILALMAATGGLK